MYEALESRLLSRRPAENTNQKSPSQASFDFTHELLLEAMILAQRSRAAVSQVDDRGGVVFVNKGGAIRLPVKAALDHKFLRKVRPLARRPLGTCSKLCSLPCVLCSSSSRVSRRILDRWGHAALPRMAQCSSE